MSDVWFCRACSARVLARAEHERGCAHMARLRERQMDKHWTTIKEALR